jgi:glycosyltransferase involved in cell wall biosynthesis
MTKISIITPCYNARRHIEETVASVLGQTAVASGRASLEYIVRDGASSDDTVARIAAFDHPAIAVCSERDTGMYDALAKGLQSATGDIVAYLNAGDYYHKCAFEIVLDIFESGRARWLTGYNVGYNESSCVVNMNLPFAYRRGLFACGRYALQLPHVQQESTFWSRDLHSLIDFDRLRTFKSAGDYYLWLCFSREHDLKIVEGYLGGFKFHRGQISENAAAYADEVRAMTRTPLPHERLRANLDRLMWHASRTVKKKLNRDGILQYDYASGEWR